MTSRITGHISFFKAVPTAAQDVATVAVDEEPDSVEEKETVEVQETKLFDAKPTIVVVRCSQP
jgi:hypothetical protein